MSVTLGLMAASAAYSAYNNYKASEASQDEMAKQRAFNLEYTTELQRRQDTNEELAMQGIKEGMASSSISAAALGRSTTEKSVLTNMETMVGLGMEQILRDREEFEWELRSAEFKGEAIEGQMASEKSAQQTQLFGDILKTGMQSSKYYNSGLK